MIKKIKIKKYYMGKYDYRYKAYYTDIAKTDIFHGWRQAPPLPSMVESEISSP